jgi:hypothetical protein
MDAARIGSGTFADARIAASNVSQHATSFDDNKIVNDISTLALRQASNENKAAYNTNSMYVDVFQDSTGITGLTNTTRSSFEYIDTLTTGATTYTPSATSQYKGSATSTADGTSLSIDSSTGYFNIGAISTSGIGNATANYGARIDLGANRTLTSPLKWIFRSKQYPNSGPQNTNAGVMSLNFSTGTTSGYVFDDADTNVIIPTVTLGSVKTNGDSGGWSYWGSGFSGSANNLLDYSQIGNFQTSFYHADNSNYSGIDTEFIQYAWSGNATGRYLQIALNSTYAEFGELHITDANGSILKPWNSQVTNATGSFESNAITAPSSTNKMGAIITYQDNAGTNTLNTDIVLKLSANGGTNYATATMTALPDFATGIKMAKVNDLSVTAGTSLKYKIEFANQAAASKEARIRGVSLQY